ncbi:MAG: hypothetical protein O7H41_15395, partial [Planctomycetota bacterium]|nr:hypothetical protein [Planctomycetota bacterium]
MAPAEMTTPDERPRVRPAVWLLLFSTGGAGLLYSAERGDWLLDALASGMLHNLTYYLAWAALGIAYAILSSILWIRWISIASRWRGLIFIPLISLLMVGGSQLAARRAQSSLLVVIYHTEWDLASETFTIHALAPESIARAIRRGDLRIELSAERYYGADVHDTKLGDTFVRREEPQAYPLQPAHPDYTEFVPIDTLSLAWDPFSPPRVRSDAALLKTSVLNRRGQRVGS